MKKKVIIIMMICLAFIVFLLGCNMSENSSQNNSTFSGTSKNKNVTLSVFMTSVEKFKSGIQTDPIAQEIEKKTGVSLNITSVNTISDYGTKLSTLIASGDLPDLFYVRETSILNNLIESGSIMDLKELIKSNGKNLNKFQSYKINFSEKFKSNNTGKVYVIPFSGGNPNDPMYPNFGQYIRYDLYKALGYPKIDSWEDLINVLYEMQKRFPKTKEGKDCYGLSSWWGDGQGWGDWVSMSNFPRIGSISEGSLSLGMVNNEILGNAYLDKSSSLFQTLWFYYRAKQKGILDPDAPMQKWYEYTQKIKEGRVYMVPALWVANNLMDHLGEKAYMPVPPFKNSDRYIETWVTPSGENKYVVSSKCKDPVKLIKLVDYFAGYEGAELVCNGIKGKHWDIVNGKPQLKDETLKALLSDEEYPIKSGVIKYKEFKMFGDADIDDRYNSPIWFKYTDEANLKRLDKVAKDYCAHNNVKIPKDVFKKLKYTKYDSDYITAMPSPEGEMKNIESKIISYFHVESIKMVLSNNDVEYENAYKKIVYNLKKIGVDKYYSWQKTEYNKIKKVLDKMKKGK